MPRRPNPKFRNVAAIDFIGVRLQLAPAAIRRDALLGHPQSLRCAAGLPEHVDRDAAARIPVAADAQELRLDLARDALADHDGAILVECAVIAEARDVELERLRLQQPLAGGV